MTKAQKQERQPNLLNLVSESNQILRKKCRLLPKAEILSQKTKNLVDDMKYTCTERKTGVGLSANQVGKSVALSVIAIKPTPARPNLEPFEKVCINTEIIKTFGKKEPMWEGCQSTAIDENGEPMMAEVPRYRRVKIKYFDKNANEHEEVVEGFVAHVIQHETDHLNGILFTDLINKDEMVSYQEFARRTMPPQKSL